MRRCSTITRDDDCLVTARRTLGAFIPSGAAVHAAGSEPPFQAQKTHNRARRHAPRGRPHASVPSMLASILAAVGPKAVQGRGMHAATACWCTIAWPGISYC